MKFTVLKSFSLTPDEAVVVANEFLEWADRNGLVLTGVRTESVTTKTHEELAEQWAADMEAIQ
jgi:hypothetical protein